MDQYSIPVISYLNISIIKKFKSFEKDEDSFDRERATALYEAILW